MDQRRKEALSRLLAGLVLNIPLYFVYMRLAVWSDVERQFRLTLYGTCLAVATLGFVLPVFWKGQPRHAPIAFVLIAFPIVVILSAIAFILQNL